jgi:hypothetical protein
MGIVALSGLRGGLSLFVLEAFLDSHLTGIVNLVTELNTVLAACRREGKPVLAT